MFFLPSIGRKFLFLLPFTAVLSCSRHNTKDQALFSVLNETLENNNTAFTYQNELALSIINDRLLDVETRGQAKIWQPKALAIKENTKKINGYIEQLKQSLIQKVGVGGSDKQKDLDERVDPVNEFFEKEGKGKELYERLNEFRTNVLNIDRDAYDFFHEKFSILPTSENVKDEPESFTTFFFHNTTPMGAIALLSHFQNMVNIMENRLLSYIKDHTTIIKEDFETTSVIIGQSSSYVQAGDSIQITAGVGAFSRSAMPKITINGKFVPLGDQACSIYKVKASIQEGKHLMPVKIQYTDQDGKQQIIEKDVEYTVARNK
ncbi:MAG TPA: hypothetical protein VNS32_17875 [Flavisolibacter sp.]|nr:hypothetical protein [Flavisolibacter sp.]